MEKKIKRPRKGFIVQNIENGMKFWCMNQLAFSKHFRFPQSKISECLSGNIDCYDKWKCIFDAEFDPIIKWKLVEEKISFKESPDDKKIPSIVDEYTAYLKNKFRDN